MPPRRLTQPHSLTPLPLYEPPYIPLSAGQISKLGAIIDGGGRQTAIDKLVKTLADTVNTLGTTVSDLGELVPVGKDDHDDEQAEKQALLDELDVMARSLVDASHMVKEMKAVLTSVYTEFRDEAREARIRQRVEEVDEWDATRIAGEREGVVGKYEDGLKKKLREYEASSMVAKYTQVAEYVQFRKYLWNSQHPDQVNNMPKANTWFTHLEGRRKSQAYPDDDEDSDLEIAQEIQSYLCPLTMGCFKHPVTSTVCPHSYEKFAIEDYLKQSAGGKAACPVTGCSQLLTLAELKPDPVLERDVRRATARAQRRRQEEEDNGEELDNEDEDEEMEDVDDSPPKKEVKRERLKRLGNMVIDTESEEDDD